MRPSLIEINYSITPTHTRDELLKNGRPIGFCIDIGTPRSVIGKQELSRLLHYLGGRGRKLRPSMNSFRFVDTVYESLGTTVFPLRTTSHVDTILVKIDVVGTNVPALLGLDAMDEHSLTPCIVTNMLVQRVVKNGKTTDDWSIKITRAQSNHLFAPLQLLSLTGFTRVQLHKLHRQIFHTSPDKLFNLIRKARPEHASPEIREALEEITARCDPCQRMKSAPLCVRVSFKAGNVRFNDCIIVDIRCVDGELVLHIVDE